MIVTRLLEGDLSTLMRIRFPSGCEMIIVINILRSATFTFIRSYVTRPRILRPGKPRKINYRVANLLLPCRTILISFLNKLVQC